MQIIFASRLDIGSLVLGLSVLHITEVEKYN